MSYEGMEELRNQPLNEMQFIKNYLIRSGYESQFHLEYHHMKMVWRVWGTLTPERRPDMIGIEGQIFALMLEHGFQVSQAFVRMYVDEKFGAYPKLNLVAVFTRKIQKGEIIGTTERLLEARFT